jgi:ribonucleoside-diphosphate reductase alpha chain
MKREQDQKLQAHGDAPATNGSGHAADYAKPELTSQTEQQSLMREETKAVFDICPDCGQALLAHEEGCKKCYGCGYSAC